MREIVYLVWPLVSPERVRKWGSERRSVDNLVYGRSGRGPSSVADVTDDLGRRDNAVFGEIMPWQLPSSIEAEGGSTGSSPEPRFGDLYNALHGNFRGSRPMV